MTWIRWRIRAAVIAWLVAALAALAMFELVSGARVAATPGSLAQLGIAGRSNTAPTIAAQGDLVVVAWHAALAGAGGGGDIFTAVSRDSGVTFGQPVQVNDIAGEAQSSGELPPRIAIGPARRQAPPELIVVWRARRERTSIRLSRSIDRGRTFGAASTVQSAEAAGERGWHSAAIAPDGRVHTLWLDHRGLVRPAGAPPHVHGAHRSDADGVAMAQKSGLYYAADGSQGPVERELAKGVCYCCKTALAVGRNGRVYAAWRHVYPGNIRDIAFISSHDGGRSFGPPARVAQDDWQIAGCPDDGPAIALDAEDRAHVVWPTVVKGPEPEGALFYATTRDGRTFTARQRIPTLGSPKPTHPQIAFAGGNRLVLAWDEVGDGTRKSAIAIMKTRDADSPTFDRPIVLDPSGTASVYPVVAAAGAHIVAAWTSGSGEAAVIALRRFDPALMASH